MASQGIAKKTRGRQKIEMKKIENGEDKLITFSKRRSGICKKINELAILTGAKIGFVVYSPAGKPFSFGHPSVKAIANRFTGRGDDRTSNSTNPLVEAHRQLRIDRLTTQYNELVEKADAEKEKCKKLKEKVKGVERNGWWDAPIEGFNPQHLAQLVDACNSIHIALTNNVSQITGQSTATSSSNQPQPHSIHQEYDVFDQNELPRSRHNNGKWPRLV